MRILLFLLLGILVLGAILVGLRLMWRSLHPLPNQQQGQQADASDNRPLLNKWELQLGRVLLLALAFMFLMLSLDRILTHRQTPSDYQPPPKVDSTGKAFPGSSKQFY